MARANLNKSKKVSNSTTMASKYIPKRPRICINWNSPLQTQIYLVHVPLNVNTVKQDLLHKKQFLKILRSEVWKGGFQLIQILGLLGMYFDAVGVEFQTFLLLFRLALVILCYACNFKWQGNSWKNFFLKNSNATLYRFWTHWVTWFLDRELGVKMFFYLLAQWFKMSDLVH